LANRLHQGCVYSHLHPTYSSIIRAFFLDVYSIEIDRKVQQIVDANKIPDK